MKILVTDGNQRAALAVTRSLGRTGHKVLVAERHSQSIAASSKYCSQELIYPSPLKDPQGFINYLLSKLGETPIDILIPITDLTATLVSSRRAEFDKLTNVALPCQESLEIVQDKGKLLAMAESLGVPIPNTWEVESSGTLDDLALKLNYPVVVKSKISRFFDGTQWHFGTVEYVHRAPDFVETYKRLHAEIPFPLIQEKINGPGAGVFVLCNHGEPVALFAHRRVREKPPSGGTSVVSESVPVDKLLSDYTLRIMKKLNWHGVAMAEYKIDDRDGTAKLMEINGRFWGSLQLAIAAGVDFPNLLVELMQGKQSPGATPYRVGVRCRWLLGDLDNLMTIWLNKRSSLSLRPDHKGRVGTAVDFLKEFFNGSVNELWQPGDRRPAITELKAYIKIHLHGRQR